MVGKGSSHVAFSKKFPGGKGNVRGCVVTMQQSGPKSSHILRQSP
jgi:hypothetical protein